MTGNSKVLRTVVRDCLYLNWALPVELLPELPESLRYEEHRCGSGRCAFASALLFRHEHLHLAGLPFLRLSYPQFNLRLYVRDHEGVPSVFFQKILVPGWVVPSARLVAHQPAQAAQFAYPRPSIDSQEEVWRWEVVRDVALRLSASKTAPRAVGDPDLGGWEQTVDYFRHRPRGYVLSSNGLHPVATSQEPVPLWSLQASVHEPGLLIDSLELRDPPAWPDPHSAWLCPTVPYEFELSAETVRHSLNGAAAPAAPGAALFQGVRRSRRRTAA